MEQKQEHRFVMTNEVVASAFHEEKDLNMKIVEKPSEQVWQDKESGKMKQGEIPPFAKATLIAGVGDLIPEGLNKKSVKKVENKAVKKSEDK
jgi:hypothetical protein